MGSFIQARQHSTSPSPRCGGGWRSAAAVTRRICTAGSRCTPRICRPRSPLRIDTSVEVTRPLDAYVSHLSSFSSSSFSSWDWARTPGWMVVQVLPAERRRPPPCLLRKLRVRHTKNDAKQRVNCGRSAGHSSTDLSHCLR